MAALPSAPLLRESLLFSGDVRSRTLHPCTHIDSYALVSRVHPAV